MRISTLEAIKKSKSEEIIKEINKREQAIFDKFINDSKIKALKKEHRRIQLKAIDLAKQLDKLRETLEKITKAITKEANNKRISVSISGDKEIGTGGYNYLYDLKNLKEIELDLNKSYTDLHGTIIANSVLAKRAAKKLDAAYLSMMVAVETNNKAELLKLIEDFKALKI